MPLPTIMALQNPLKRLSIGWTNLLSLRANNIKLRNKLMEIMCSCFITSIEKTNEHKSIDEYYDENLERLANH